jgi:hypothetical protein
VHDRRIDGTPTTFGNASVLFMNAMTWYDHETRSIWSQPWGRAIIGELKGIELELLPFQLTTWSSWREQHPDTLVMVTDQNRLLWRRQGFNPDFVIGLVFADNAKAYPFPLAQELGLINDLMVDIPIVLWVQGETYHAYLRQVDNQVLIFELNENNGTITDTGTNSVWDLNRGIATDGPLTGEGLLEIPSLSSYDWAWRDFYPDTEFYSP